MAKTIDLRRQRKVVADVTIDTAGLATEPKQDVQITGLAAILAKIIAAPSTEAKQDAAITALGLLSKETTLAALSAKFGTLGQKVSAGSAPVVLSSEQEAILQIIAGKTNFGANSTVTTIPSATASTLLKAGTISRKEIIIFNNSTSSLWVSYSSPAAIGKGFLLNRGETFIEDKYTGPIYGWWGTATGNAQVTQVTT